MVQVQENGPRQMCGLVGALPGRRIGKLVTHIADQPVAASEVGGERLEIDDRAKRFRTHGASTRSSQAWAVSMSWNTRNSASTKIWESHVLQVSHWLSVSTAMR